MFFVICQIGGNIMDVFYLIPLLFIPNAKIQNFWVNLFLQSSFILEAKRLQSFCASEIGVRSCVNFSLIFSLYAAFLFIGPGAYLNNFLLGLVSRFICILIYFNGLLCLSWDAILYTYGSFSFKFTDTSRRRIPWIYGVICACSSQIL